MLADARLQGTWLIEFKGAGGTKAVINFDPVCKEGPCDVTVTTDPVIRLHQKGTLYKSTAKGSFGSTCSGTGIKSNIDLSLRVKRADMDGSEWLAQSLVGTLRQSVSPQKGCAGAKQTYKLKGTPTRGSPQGRNDLPGISLQRPAPEPTSTGAGGSYPDVPALPNIETCIKVIDASTGDLVERCY